MHHHHKKDAPSGTALALGEAVAAGHHVSLSQKAVHGRVGQVGERTQGEIGFHAVRGGDVIGDHVVIFAGNGERIELTHRSSNRRIYADGAIRAALWAVHQPYGLYSMQDVLATPSA
jgi:4-hydroxy-tetrahydrodipicolinate reductase